MLPGFAPLVPASSSDILVNDFSQYAAGTTPGDWTNRYATGSFTYIVQTVAGSVSGKALRWTKTTAVQEAISWNAVPNIADVEILIRARAIAAVVSTSHFLIGPYARGSGAAGSTQGIRFGAYASTAFTNFWSGQIGTYIFGTFAGLGTFNSGTSPNYAANVWYYHRSRAVGSTMQYKLWRSGAAEPGSWTDTQTSAAIPGAGWVGLQNSDSSPNVEIDYFAVSLQGRTIPVPV